MRFTKRGLIMLSVLGALLLGAVALVYYPQSSRLGDLEEKIVAERRTLAGQSDKAAVVPGLLRQVTAMKSRYSNHDRRLPKRKELGGFLREISERLADEELSNQLIEPGSPTRQELFHTLPITMKFKGSYLALASLLGRIQSMERITRVEKLLIGSQAKRGGKDLDIELQLNIYFTES